MTTLRANEIGADVYSTTETELDKNNLDIQKQETEHRVAYPELSPGRALLDVETGALFEIMHRVNGVTDTVEGLQTESEEYFNWKYRTPEGQDWGGIIQHYYISYAKRESPSPNAHGEIQAPLNRPSEREITDIKPGAFEANVLFEDEEPRPFLLLERPEVTYEEVMPGDTYDILGWYDPSERAAADRLKPVENIAHRFPDIVGVDYTKTTSKVIPELGIRVRWDDVSDTTTVQIAPGDGDVDYEVTTMNRTSDFHITTGSAFGDAAFLIDSPFDAKEDIKSLSASTRWDSDRNYWAVMIENGRETLTDMVNAFISAGWTISLDNRTIDAFGEMDVTITPDQEVTVSIHELFEYTFTEEIELGVGISIPGADVTIDTTEIDASIVAFTETENNLSVTGVDDQAENHIETVEDGKVGFDCPKANASLVKSLDWQEARYEWNNADANWLVNASAAGDLITTFADAGEPITAPINVLTALGEEDTLTEERHREIDESAVTGLDSYKLTAHTDCAGQPAVETVEETTATCETLHGTSPADPDALSLMALDLSIADTPNQAGMTVDLGGADLRELPPSVKDEWQPSTNADDEDVYEWFHPMTSARIRVEETEGWGTEYELHVKEPYMDEAEHIVTLADERMVVLTVISHLKALTRFD